MAMLGVGGVSMVANCVECGAMAQSGARFCVVCGAALPSKRCATCGFANIDEASFCANCGAGLAGAHHNGNGFASIAAADNGVGAATETVLGSASGPMSGVITIRPSGSAPTSTKTVSPPAAIPAVLGVGLETEGDFGAWLRRAFGDPRSAAFRQMSLYVLVLVYFSIASIVFESIPELGTHLQAPFQLLEVVITSLFALEYAANVYAATDRWGYVFSIWGLIDLVAIVPSLLTVMDLRFLRVVRTVRLLRVLRVLRVLKLGRLARAAGDVTGAGAQLAQDLQLYLINLFCVVITSATLLYYAESGVDGTSFTHIPAAMWWVIQTITMSGSSAIGPVTATGRGIGVVTMLAGVALFAWLVAIVTRAMMRAERA
jgi:voltage-gated potassium channel